MWETETEGMPTEMEVASLFDDGLKKSFNYPEQSTNILQQIEVVAQRDSADTYAYPRYMCTCSPPFIDLYVLGKISRYPVEIYRYLLMH